MARKLLIPKIALLSLACKTSRCCCHLKYWSIVTPRNFACGTYRCSYLEALLSIPFSLEERRRDETRREEKERRGEERRGEKRRGRDKGPFGFPARCKSALPSVRPALGCILCPILPFLLVQPSGSQQAASKPIGSKRWWSSEQARPMCSDQ